MKLEILGLSEVRWPNFGEHRLPSGQILRYSGLRGEHAPRHCGVGFLLSAHAYTALIKWEPINERIIVARFRTRVRNRTIIQCYAPTDAAEMQEKENFYSQLNAVVDKIPKGDIKIYMGDFNAKVGSDNSDYEHVMGRHGLGEMNENGELLAEFCGNNDMVIGGSPFPHRPVHKVTWVSRDGFTENQIDHICISRKWRRSLLDVRNKRSADIASDHHLLIGEIRLRIARIQRQEEKIGRRFNTRRLEDAAVRRFSWRTMLEIFRMVEA
ncbi:craniofacial development protein 2-like [Topomyia yanbarensis]|uniref:craniofacial development protein 2-like n=1 Tax=Topomyia yanbarensis TaxID=2498891 RepID=UPI00273C0F10|nr:craniofacial development protein 2-like [Topomyia yanbarensis]